MRTDAIRQGLDQARPLAGAGTLNGFAHHIVDRQDIIAIDQVCRYAKTRASCGEAGCGALFLTWYTDSPAIVLHNQDYRSLVATLSNPVRRAENPKELRYRDFVDKGYVIAGSAATVRERLKEEVVKGLHVGNLMVLLQIGSMPHELTIENIDRFARDVLPDLRSVWDDDGWVNHWWPERLRRGAPAPTMAVGAGRA